MQHLAYIWRPSCKWLWDRWFLKGLEIDDRIERWVSCGLEMNGWICIFQNFWLVCILYCQCALPKSQWGCLYTTCMDSFRICLLLMHIYMNIWQSCSFSGYEKSTQSSTKRCLQLFWSHKVAQVMGDAIVFTIIAVVNYWQLLTID